MDPNNQFQIANSSNNINNNDMEDEDDSKIFPQRLMAILSDELNQEAICWLPHGRAFIVRNRKLFAETVMPRYFSRKAKYSSFTRKLNRWNFIRVSSGPELGAYNHEFFLRDRQHLAAQMFCKNARTMLAMSSSSASTSSAMIDSSEKNIHPAPRAIEGNDSFSSVAPLVKPIQHQQSVVQQSEHVVRPSFTHLQKPSASGMVLKNDNALMSMATGPGSVNIIQLLERQMQMLKQQQHQEQANRLFMAMHLGQQQNAPAASTPQSAFAQQEMRILQIRRMMELSRCQQQVRQPSNNRASAA